MSIFAKFSNKVTEDGIKEQQATLKQITSRMSEMKCGPKLRSHFPDVLAHFEEDDKVWRGIDGKWEFYNMKDVILHEMDDDQIVRLVVRFALLKRRFGEYQVTPEWMMRANKLARSAGFTYDIYTEDDINRCDAAMAKIAATRYNPPIIGRKNPEDDTRGKRQESEKISDTKEEEKDSIILEHAEETVIPDLNKSLGTQLPLAIFNVIADVAKIDDDSRKRLFDSEAYKTICKLISLYTIDKDRFESVVKENSEAIKKAITDKEIINLITKFARRFDTRIPDFSNLNEQTVSEFLDQLADNIKPVTIMRAIKDVKAPADVKKILESAVSALIQEYGYNTNKHHYDIVAVEDNPKVVTDPISVDQNQTVEIKNTPADNKKGSAAHEEKVSRSRASKEADKIIPNTEFFSRMQSIIQQNMMSQKAYENSEKVVENTNLFDSNFGKDQKASKYVVGLNQTIAGPLAAMGVNHLTYKTKKDGNIQVIIDKDNNKSFIIDPGFQYGNGFAIRVKLSTGKTGWLPMWVNPALTTMILQSIVNSGRDTAIINRDEYVKMRDAAYVNNEQFYKTFDMSYIGWAIGGDMNVYNQIASKLMWLVDKNIVERVGRMSVVDFDLTRNYIGLIADKAMTKPFLGKLNVGKSFVAKLVDGHFEIYLQGQEAPAVEVDRSYKAAWERKAAEPQTEIVETADATSMSDEDAKLLNKEEVDEAVKKLNEHFNGNSKVAE